MSIKNFLFCLVVVSAFSIISVSRNVRSPHVYTLSPAKKRIVLFMCKGGGGHIAVAKGLNEYLKDDYDVTTLNIFQDVIGPFDTLRTLSFGKMAGEDFYNFCLQCRWTTVANNFVTLGRWGVNLRQNTIEWLMLEFFKFEKPDLIISVIPMLDGALLNVAQKLEVPLLIITNDLDSTNYINGIKDPKYPKLCYTLAFDDKYIREKIVPANIPAHQIRVTGFPLRPEFFKKKNRKAIKKDFALPDDKPIVMLLMGGAGSLANYRYVRALAKMDTPMHLIVCLGRNETLKKNISKILLPSHITTTVIGFTDRIADLMAVSDVIITKPGPGSICEAIASHLPMIIDQTSGTLWWEGLNIDFVKRNGFGDVITNFKEVPTILKKYLENKGYRETIKNRMENFKGVNFSETIKPLVKEMLDLTIFAKAQKPDEPTFSKIVTKQATKIPVH